VGEFALDKEGLTVRCFTGLIILAWLFYYPPAYGGKLFPELEGHSLKGAPLDEWIFDQAFDTGRQCEKHKWDRVTSYMGWAEKLGATKQTKDKLGDLALRVSDGRCIPSENLEFLMKSEREKFNENLKELQDLNRNASTSVLIEGLRLFGRKIVEELKAK